MKETLSADLGNELNGFPLPQSVLEQPLERIVGVLFCSIAPKGSRRVRWQRLLRNMNY